MKAITKTITLDWHVVNKIFDILREEYDNLTDVIREEEDPDLKADFQVRLDAIDAFDNVWNSSPDTESSVVCKCDTRTLLIKGCQCGGK